MTTFTLKIECGNAAFDPDPIPEILKILKDVQFYLDHGIKSSTIFDTNGNPVGLFHLPKETT